MAQGFSGACGGGRVSSLVAGSAVGAANAAGGAGVGSFFRQGCSLGDELAPADQGLGHGDLKESGSILEYTSTIAP